MAQASEFNAIRISLASPEQIKSWSYGEVTKPETINYRTLRPEKDGLFCERIFGPTKDWECYCGKYKKIRYKGVICDRCGVEVARAKVRRERMGHISLAGPVAHIWFAKGTPSRLGLLTDLSLRNLERVLYFAQYIITSVNEEARDRAVKMLQDSYTEEEERLQQETEEHSDHLSQGTQEAPSLEGNVDAAEGPLQDQPTPQAAVATSSEMNGEETVPQVRDTLKQQLQRLQEEMEEKTAEVQALQPLQLLTENRYRELRSRFGYVFKASMGAEAILEILRNIDLNALREQLQQEVQSTSGQRRKKAIKRLRVVEAFRKSNNKPEWMILTTLPVLPPDLRPMVQLDGGRFATSDLNDLYRRVINRNNRLRRLLELRAPEIIIRNEKRMLQEAVDALIDNGRRGRAIAGSHNHKLKSLSDLLRGKQGRFRQNLLGKRVDYSGRSVIVVGPNLRLDQCGLPQRMALELFKPFVMNQLVLQGYAHNIKSAKRAVERVLPEVWDILEEVIKERPVLLNRAPTLHRLGIQAFQPVLIEGSAIQIHPLVCTAFNADFDGDQMAVHIPISREAVLEARKIMLGPYNMLSPSSGEPIVAPTLDMVLGCYYLTLTRPGAKGEGFHFRTFEEAELAHDLGQVDLQAEIVLRDPIQPDGWLHTTVGRIIFSDVLPQELGFYNQVIDKKAVKDIVAECYRKLGNEGTVAVLDAIKNLGFQYATQSGVTIAINDIEVAPEKPAILQNASQQIDTLEAQFEQGLITEEERYRGAVEVWTKAGDEMTKIIEENLPTTGGIYMMANSGAKGNIAQIKQMAGMRGLMSNPRGRIIDLPIKSSFREGLTVLEYFISTHGARKGLADTALRTADSGYLTRRLIDTAQEVITLQEDCGTQAGTWIVDEVPEEDVMISPFEVRIMGRIAAAPISHPQTGEILVERNQEIDEEATKVILSAGIKVVYVRSPLNCDAPRGICQLCYGRSPATGRLAMLGEAVGIIAAQSIGEPGTQLTMRTFHTGGVAGLDITSGLPRVEELFEARSPKGKATLSELDGVVEIFEDGHLVDQGHKEKSDYSLGPVSITSGKAIRVVNQVPYTEEYSLPGGYQPTVTEGDLVDPGTRLARLEGAPSKSKKKQVPQPADLVSSISGKIHITDGKIQVSWQEVDAREYTVPPNASITVKTGDLVHAGQKLTTGVKDPNDILRIEGKEAVERYLMEQVQTVYRNQGVSIKDKHIEIILRQILRRVRVDSSGDTELLPGQLIDRMNLQEINAKVLAEGGEPATASPVLLGITRSSLNTDSFLAAASFQETARVLTEAAVNGTEDHLLGLKENVIIGRLIPARFDLSEEGRHHLGLDEPQPVPVVTHMFPELGPDDEATYLGEPLVTEADLAKEGLQEIDLSLQDAMNLDDKDKELGESLTSD